MFLTWKRQCKHHTAVEHKYVAINVENETLKMLTHCYYGRSWLHSVNLAVNTCPGGGPCRGPNPAHIWRRTPTLENLMNHPSLEAVTPAITNQTKNPQTNRVSQNPKNGQPVSQSVCQPIGLQGIDQETTINDGKIGHFPGYFPLSRSQ